MMGKKSCLFVAGLLWMLSAMGCATSDRTKQCARPGWNLTFHDEFDGKTLDPDRWMTNYRGNTTMPAVYVVQDGVLHLRIDRDAPPNRPGKQERISGIETRVTNGGQGFAQKYGWFEIRARCARGSGVQSSFWLSPLDKKYPQLKADGGTRLRERDGTEIDVFEQLGREPQWNNFTIGYGGKSQDAKQARHVRFPFSLTEDFHLYAVEWDAEKVIWYVDGQAVHQSDKPPQTPFFIRLSVYEGDNAWRGEVEPANPYPKDFEIDYVRVYSKDASKKQELRS